MIEFEDPEYRAQQLAGMIGIEDLVWVQVEGHDKVWSISNEDLERSNADKTSSVHFMRFELSDDMAASLKAGAALSMGVEHKAYCHEASIDDDVRQSLINDLD